MPWATVRPAGVASMEKSLAGGMTVMLKVCGALVSVPPLAVPPSSWMRTVTVAAPLAPNPGVKVRVPVGLTAGWAEKRALLSLLTMKLDHLARLVGRSPADGAGPAGDGVRPGVLVHLLVGAPGEGRDIVDGADRHVDHGGGRVGLTVECLVGEGVAPAEVRGRVVAELAGGHRGGAVARLGHDAVGKRVTVGVGAGGQRWSPGCPRWW